MKNRFSPLLLLLRPKTILEKKFRSKRS